MREEDGSSGGLKRYHDYFDTFVLPGSEVPKIMTGSAHRSDLHHSSVTHVVKRDRRESISN